MKLPLEKYSADPEAMKGSWVLVQDITPEHVDGNSVQVVSRSGRVSSPTLVDQQG